MAISDAVKDRLYEILSRHLGYAPDEFAPIDSLILRFGMINDDKRAIRLHIENEFDISITEREFGKCKLVGEVLNLITVKLYQDHRTE